MCVNLIPFKPLFSIVSIQRANPYHCMRLHILRSLKISSKLCLIYSPLLSTNTQNNDKLTNARKISSEKKQNALQRKENQLNLAGRWKPYCSPLYKTNPGKT